MESRVEGRGVVHCDGFKALSLQDALELCRHHLHAFAQGFDVDRGLTGCERAVEIVDDGKHVGDGTFCGCGADLLFFFLCAFSEVVELSLLAQCLIAQGGCLCEECFVFLHQRLQVCFELGVLLFGIFEVFPQGTNRLFGVGHGFEHQQFAAQTILFAASGSESLGRHSHSLQISKKMTHC